MPTEKLDTSFRFPTGADLGRRIQARLSELPPKRPDLSQYFPETVDRRAKIAPTPDILSRKAMLSLLGSWKAELRDGSERTAIGFAENFTDAIAPTQDLETPVTRAGLQTLLHTLAVAGLGRSQVFKRLSALATLNRTGL